MKIVLIIQARMTSTRLPGKVLKTVLGKPLLAYQLERLRRVKSADGLVVATTTNDTDEPIVALCQELGVAVYRGSETDVLSRYYEAAQVHQADAIVRVTSDCPLIDPDVLETLIQFYRAHADQYDYVSNSLGDPPTFPRGLDTEVFSMNALAEAHTCATHPAEREHVTPYLYRRPEYYRLHGITHPVNLSHHRWTVDTPEDFELIERILSALYPINPRFGMADVLALLEEHLDWMALNAHISQKPVMP